MYKNIGSLSLSLYLSIYLSIDLLIRRLIIPYLRGSDKKVEQTAMWILTSLKFVKEGKKDKETHGRCQFQCHWGAFFEQFSTNFELRELAWEPFGR